jgi:hypothetical protein
MFKSQKEPRSRGLAARLNRLEANAHNTMNQAQSFIAALREALLGLLEEISDGITIEVTKVSKESMWDFLTGKTAKLPIGIRIILKEDNLDNLDNLDNVDKE